MSCTLDFMFCIGPSTQGNSGNLSLFFSNQPSKNIYYLMITVNKLKKNLLPIVSTIPSASRVFQFSSASTEGENIFLKMKNFVY